MSTPSDSQLINDRDADDGRCADHGDSRSIPSRNIDPNRPHPLFASFRVQDKGEARTVFFPFSSLLK